MGWADCGGTVTIERVHVGWLTRVGLCGSWFTIVVFVNLRQIQLIEIIPFEPIYSDGVIDVILPIQRIEFGIDISLDDQPDLRIIPEFYQRGIGNFWVALDQGEVVGTIALVDIQNNQAALRKMFVKASHRGPVQGISMQLLETMLSWCRQSEITEIYLGTVDRLKAAHRFYEKNRFQEMDKSDLPEQFPIMAIDTKFYRRSV
jgi:N-acetylglutamate synthase-like GNAT family acetyltransferase